MYERYAEDVREICEGRTGDMRRIPEGCPYRIRWSDIPTRRKIRGAGLRSVGKHEWLPRRRHVERRSQRLSVGTESPEGHEVIPLGDAFGRNMTRGTGTSTGSADIPVGTLRTNVGKQVPKGWLRQMLAPPDDCHR